MYPGCSRRVYTGQGTTRVYREEYSGQGESPIPGIPGYSGLAHTPPANGQEVTLCAKVVQDWSRKWSKLVILVILEHPE